MPYVMRNQLGAIVAISQVQAAGLQEELPASDTELAAFLGELGGGASHLDATDKGLIRVLEDLVDVLVDKNVILFTDLPEDAQVKINYRRQLRSELMTR